MAVGPRRYAPMAAVGVAAFGAFLAFMDSTVVNVAFPNIQAAFPHARFGTLSWVLNSYNVVFAGLLVLSGRVADLLGRRRLFQIGLVLFMGTSALCAMSTSVAMLIAFRVVQGAGAAMLVPASLGIVVHASSQEHRAHALSLWAAAGALAAGLGPPIGGALVDLSNWRLVFIVNVPLGAAAWVLTRRSVLESRAPGRRVWPDLRGALTLSLALGAVTLGIVQAGSWGWAGPATLAAFGVSAMALAVTVHSSRHHRSPILDPRLLRIRGFALSNLITLAAGLGLYTYLLTHILWLHYVWGYSLLLAGLAVAPGAVVAAVVAIPFGRLADRVGDRAVVVPGALVWAGAYLWYATRVGQHPDFVGQWLPGQVLSGIGVGATLPVAASGGLATVPAGRYATASAVNACARQIGGVLGIALLTILVAHPTSVTLPGQLRHGWELAGWSFVAAAMIGLLFERTGPAEETDDGGRSPLLATAEPVVVAEDPSAESDLLGELPERVLDQVLAAASTLQLPAGATLFDAGDPADALYVLQSGRLEVRLPDGAVADVYPGAALGDLALLSDSPRSATVVARRDSTLYQLSRDEFERIIDSEPVVLRALARGVARQLQRSRPASAPRPSAPKVIAVVALDAGVHIDSFAASLHAGLARTHRVVRLESSTPDVLQRAEEHHDRVLLVAGPVGDNHHAALRQADRVVLAASGPEPIPAAWLSAAPCDIVLTGAAPTADQIERWHEATRCRRVYHAGPDPSAWEVSLRPLVARLAGQSVALVLAGGGARALAHLGVLHALEEAGVVVDRVAGTSMGSMIAAAYATGASAAEVDRLVFDEMVIGQPFRDWRISPTSLARGQRGKDMLHRCFGADRLEALTRELVVVSTDLYARVPVYHRLGSVAEAVAASMALPVLFPPQVIGNRVLVDGSLADNCPVAAFSDLPEGPVVAVRIGAASSSAHGTRVPSLAETLMRVMQMGDRPGETPGGPAPTVAVTPDTRGIGLLEFHQIDAAREAGRQAGQAAVAALRHASSERQSLLQAASLE